jgi:hypothetical protein
MEELTKNKIFRFLFIFFILVSLVHIGYAVYTNRGMYVDGSYYLLSQLCYLSKNEYRIIIDAYHTRFCIIALLQLPVMFAYFIGIKSKFFLMGVYSFAQVGFPFLFLLWNFFLTKRTNKTDVLACNIFCYGAVLCLFMIFGIVETLIGVTLNFILWNYLSADINYKKRDLYFILILLFIMLGTYEYTIYFGLFFFIAHFLYVSREKIKFNKIVKRIIGYGSLFAAIFNIIYMLMVPDEDNEIARFFEEALDIWPECYHLNILLSIITVVFIALFFFKKKNIGIWSLLLILSVFAGAFTFLLLIPFKSIDPILEGHCRTISCYAPFLIIIGLYIKDLLNKKSDNNRITNFICIALVCCIFQTCWQIVETYYWDRNIQYMKKELKNEPGRLYFPLEHESISSFYNKDLRRHIWHSTYSAVSVLFSEDYELKTLLMLYPEEVERGNHIEKDLLYVFNNGEEEFLVVPYGAVLPLKTIFWDVTKCAEALKEYNIEHNINQNQ